MRSLDHAIETVYSPRHQPVTDVLSLEAINRLASALPAARRDPADVGARAAGYMGAWLSYFGEMNLSLGLSHAIGHQLGPKGGVPHGVTSCIILPQVMRFLAPATAARQRLIADALGVDTTAMSDAVAAEAAARAVEALVAELGQPARLSQVGVGASCSMRSPKVSCRTSWWPAAPSRSDRPPRSSPSSRRRPEVDPFLVADGVSKRFPGVVALDGVHFDLRPSEVHVLLGENGAGKSTLVKILSGAYRPDAGEVRIDGQPVRVYSPSAARRAGISTVYQELALATDMTVAQNIFLGREEVRGWANLLDKSAMRARTRDLLQLLGPGRGP